MGVVIGVFFTVAVLSGIARIFIRIRTRRFGLDDYLVLLALISLSGATGVALKYSKIFFLLEALYLNPAYIYAIEDDKSAGSVLAVADCLNPLTWTATFAVKLSFLVLFRQLVKRVSKKITIYIWIVILFTVLAWVFALIEPFISCHYFDNLELCLSRSTLNRIFILDATVVSLDMATDIMVIIIPIMILRKSQISITQKIGLAALLSLSIVMVLMSAIRMTAYAYHPGLLDLTWSYFWMYLESCVAIIMASISAISPFFVNLGRAKKACEKREKKNQVPLSDQRRLLRKNQGLNQVGWEAMGREGLLPAAPLASLSRMHKFPYHNARLTEGTDTMQSTSHPADTESQSWLLSACAKDNESS